MKIYGINGSPRVDGNTATMLKKALEGAAETGAEVELIHLGQLKAFTGCRSCFACKRKGGRRPGECIVQDGLTEVLERISQGDGLILGTPVYFGGETGLFREFFERLSFPKLRYDQEYSSLAPKSFPVAFIYTMNVAERQFEKYHYGERLGLLPAFAGRLFGCKGQVQTLYAFDTFQFDDYSQYDVPLFDPEHKAQVRSEQFPLDCQAAYELGRKMAKNE